MGRSFSLFFLLILLQCAQAIEPSPTGILSSLVDPVKIDALDGKRATNPRLRKMIYWLETARLAGADPEAVILDAQRRAGYAGSVRADADRESLVRNRIILERLGCLDAGGMVVLRKGNSPTITKGPYAGDTVDADHIIPRAVAPELDDKIYDLEFMPSKMNKAKGAKIGVRQKQLAEKWRKLGLLSEVGFGAVMGTALQK